MTTIKALREEYQQLTGAKALNKWALPELRELVVKERAKQEREAEAQRAKDELISERLAEAGRRQDWETWSQMARGTEDGYWLRRAVQMCKDALAAHEQAKEKFVQSFQNNPLYAITWGQSMVDASAQAEVGYKVMAMFDRGYSAADIKQEVTNEVVRYAAHPASSTSVLSNYCETAVGKAWARLLSW